MTPVQQKSSRRLRMGMVGGGRDAFIGSVHRMAARLDGEIDFVAGALSSTPEKSLASGRELGLSDHRNYPNWRAMLDAESSNTNDAIDFVTIVTPNATHYEIARASIDRGIPVVIDKPLVTTVEQAAELADVVTQRNVICCVTYNYSGYPLVKQAREMVRNGELGEIRKVIVEYSQGWLSNRIETTNQKQAAWRANPEMAGQGGAIADIGTHAEHLARYVTGLEIEAICADLTSMVKGRVLDDDANMLLRFTNGARGVLVASQICSGERNNLRLRVWGTKAGLDWQQENPNRLSVTPLDGPELILHRGDSSLCKAAKLATRLPAGHPEAFIEAFANVYRGVATALRRRLRLEGPHDDELLDYPSVHDGVKGVRFIDAAIASSRNGSRWTKLT